MGRLWVPLDADFQDDDRVIELSLEAEALYVRSLALAKRLASDGRFRRSHLARLCDKMTSDPDDLAAELEDAELWVATEHAPGGPNTAYRIRAWAEWNDPVAEENRVRAGRRRGAAIANHKRWHVAKGVDDPSCEYCNPSLSDRLSDSPASRSRSLETETETEKDNPPVVPPARGKRPLPPDWEPNDTHQRLATQHDRDLQHEAQAFRDYCQAHDRRYKDHDAAFRQWLRNDQYRAPPNGQQPRLTAAEQKRVRTLQAIQTATGGTP